jgi:hypothetical protein
MTVALNLPPHNSLKLSSVRSCEKIDFVRSSEESLRRRGSNRIAEWPINSHVLNTGTITEPLPPPKINHRIWAEIEDSKPLAKILLTYSGEITLNGLSRHPELHFRKIQKKMFGSH